MGKKLLIFHITVIKVKLYGAVIYNAGKSLPYHHIWFYF